MGNSASTSELASLKADVNALKTKTSDYATLKTQVADASSNAAKSIDYEALAKKITDVSAYNDKVAAALGNNPGKLGEGLAAKMGNDSTVTARIVTGLQDNTTFAKTVSDKLTDDTGAFRDRLRGDKGAPGELASSKEAVKKALYDTKYTMWCADGDVCKVPAGNNGVEAPSLKVNKIQIGNWYLEQHPNGNLHIHQGNLDDWSTAVTTKRLHAREGLHIHNGQLHLPDSWTIGQNGGGDYLRFNKGGDVKGAVHESGGYWGRNYGDKFLHDWARESFVRKDKTYELRDQNQQGRHCIDAGSNGRGCNWDNTWQRFSIVETPHNRND